MKTRYTQFYTSRRKFLPGATTLIALAAVICISAFAQQYKTDIPPSIVTPDQVETRLGTLRYFDGFPDSATVQKVYDNLDFQRGTQAFLTAMPAASLVAIRKGL